MSGRLVSDGEIAAGMPVENLHKEKLGLWESISRKVVPTAKERCNHPSVLIIIEEFYRAIIFKIFTLKEFLKFER